MTAIPIVTTPHQTPFRCGTYISEDLFVQELRKKGSLTSPLFEGEADPEQTARLVYQDIVAGGHSAEAFLGITGREHDYGTNPGSVLHRQRTRSWGNARTIRTPGMRGTIVYDPVRKSSYAKYESVRDSVRDLMYRYDDPTYAYAGKVTIADVIATHAPADDANDPDSFAWFIVNVINGLRSRMTPMVPGGDWPLVPFVPADRRHYTPGRAGVAWPDLFIFHHTDGWDSLNWLTISPNSNVSATYLNNNDGTPRAQLVRHEDTPHTTGIWNPRSISWEWERYWTDPQRRQFPDRVPDSVYRNLGRHAAQVVLIERTRGNPHFQGIPKREQIRDHNDFYNTTCPGNLSMDILFEHILVALAEFDDRPADKPGMRFFPETGRYLYGGFRALWEELEGYDPHLVMRVGGPPVTDEGWAVINGQRRRIQFLVKAVLIHNPELGHPYDVTFMNREDYERMESFEEDRVA